MRHQLPIPLLAALLLLALAGAARADGGPLALHSAVTGGGGSLSAGGYSLVGAIGQPVAGTLEAGAYTLASGLGALQPETDLSVYLPLVRR